MHGDREALLFRNDEVQAVLHIVHIPDLDDAVGTCTTDQIVLVKLIQTGIGSGWLRLEFIWRHVLKFYR